MLGFIVTIVVTAVSLLILARISIGLDVDDTGIAVIRARPIRRCPYIGWQQQRISHLGISWPCKDRT